MMVSDLLRIVFFFRIMGVPYGLWLGLGFMNIFCGIKYHVILSVICQFILIIINTIFYGYLILALNLYMRFWMVLTQFGFVVLKDVIIMYDQRLWRHIQQSVASHEYYFILTFTLIYLIVPCQMLLYLI